MGLFDSISSFFSDQADRLTNVAQTYAVVGESALNFVSAGQLFKGEDLHISANVSNQIGKDLLELGANHPFISAAAISPVIAPGLSAAGLGGVTLAETGGTAQLSAIGSGIVAHPGYSALAGVGGIVGANVLTNVPGAAHVAITGANELLSVDQTTRDAISLAQHPSVQGASDFVSTHPFSSAILGAAAVYGGAKLVQSATSLANTITTETNTAALGGVKNALNDLNKVPSSAPQQITQALNLPTTTGYASPAPALGSVAGSGLAATSKKKAKKKKKKPKKKAKKKKIKKKKKKKR